MPESFKVKKKKSEEFLVDTIVVEETTLWVGQSAGLCSGHYKDVSIFFYLAVLTINWHSTQGRDEPVQ